MKQLKILSVAFAIIFGICAPEVYAGDTDAALTNGETLQMRSAQMLSYTAPEIIFSFNAPSYRPWGLAWDGTYLWLASDGDDVIYKLDPSTGAVLFSFPAPVKSYTVGLAHDGRYLWVGIYNGNRIYKMDPDTGAVIMSFRSPTRIYPGGLTFDGEYLWATGFSDPVVYKIDPSTGTVVGTVPAPGTAGRDLAWDGAYLWFINTNPRGSIYRISPIDGTVVDSFALPSVNFPIGSTFDGQYLWISGLKDNKIYQLDIGFVVPVSIDIKPGSDPNSININSRGVIPVAILTTDEFDARDVNAGTVRFGPSGAYAEQYALEDVDDDGYIDLILHFRTRDAGIAAGDTQAVLTGETREGRRIKGSDSVRVRENKRSKNK